MNKSTPLTKRAILKYFLSQQFDETTNSTKSTKSTKTNKQTKTNRIGRAKSSKYKWTTLEHNGMKFPPEYIPKKIPIKYLNENIYLSPSAEEAAFAYAKYIGTEYETNATFNRNFFNDWKKLLGKNTPIQSLSLCNFSLMKAYLVEKKLSSKEVPDPSSLNEDLYKTAILDGKPQLVSNYRMEPPGIFIGRGKNPNLGKIKSRTNPEDVIINIGANAKIPSPPPGHKWGRVIHDRTVEWLVAWKDLITLKTKYLWLSAQSDLKASSDVAKFDLARKLKKKIGLIEKHNLELLSSPDIKSRQIATSMYLIDKLAIRVGNEKSEDEADTVGCSNLRVEHIEFHDPDQITLNFLGKDSVRYTNTIEVIPIVYSNLKKFILSKMKDDEIFDLISSTDINKYLQSLMKDLTAKVFRTYNASNLFQKELNKITKKYEGLIIQPDPANPLKSLPIINQTQLKEILDEFSKANAKVARMMNHQKNISTGYKKSVDKVNENLLKLKKKLISVRRTSKKSSKKSSLKSKSNQIDKIKTLIAKSKSRLEFVKEMKNISLGTSKANYIDPRITVSFMKKFNIDVDKVFSKALQEKFKWAFTVDIEYKF